MARIRTLILDKTGTLTDGRPQIVSIDSHDGMGADDILRYAAALDQASKHPVAQAIVEAAKARGEGATVFKGRLVDIASIKQAEVIVKQAEMIASA